ncbi:MAG: PEGA domain-containing protein [Pseudomonadota bacterium]
MRTIAATISFIMLGGCLSAGGGARTIDVLTDPPGAQLTIEGVGVCETPCSVKLDRPRQARIAKAGFVATTVTLTPDRRALTIPLELAAASEDVDADELPHL